MAGNVLSGIIDIQAPGVKQATDKVADSIQKVEKSMQQAAVKIDGVTKSGENLKKTYVQLPAVLQNTATATDKVGVAAARVDVSLRRVRPGADQATNSLLNLGRVAQDAPFGILGIANNLNPLFESLGRTSRAAGGFGGALKAMGSSLIGPAGIGVALSVVSSL
jgi:ABC-type transporter Mla subunit MlaD